MDKKLAIPALALLALLGSGCDVAEVATAPDEETKHVTTSDQATDDEPNADQGAAADAAVSGDVRSLRKKDVVMRLRVTEKKCYGSAGCNVGYEVKPALRQEFDLDGDYDITYRVIGDESGPQIGTVTLREDGSYDEIWPGFASTTSESVELRVRVDSVTEAGGW